MILIISFKEHLLFSTKNLKAIEYVLYMKSAFIKVSLHSGLYLMTK